MFCQFISLQYMKLWATLKFIELVFSKVRKYKTIVSCAEGTFCHYLEIFSDEEIIEETNVAAPLISISATTTTTAPTTPAATAPVPVVANFGQSLPSLVPSVAQPIAGPSFPCGTFYSAHPATHAATAPHP